MKALKNINWNMNTVCSRIDHTGRMFLFYLYDYGQFRNLRDENYSSSWERRNHKYESDQAEINENIKHYVQQQNWQLETHGSNTSLNQVLQFKNQSELNHFLTRARTTVDELNHHPEWRVIDGTKLSVSLTTHDLGNVVGPNDYLLAAKLTGLYNDNSYFLFNNRRAFTNLSSVILLVAGFGLLVFFMETKQQYRITSRDFILSDITGYRKGLYKNTYPESSLQQGSITNL